ncbi:MAG: hypothetical protein JWO22_4178 [Frankiales bacterium]|nr:hypothetical protein [Frankiales bacterium]
MTVDLSVEPSPPRPDGMVLAPFAALRYAADVDLRSVTSPPYDVIDAAGVVALEQSSDVNVVRLILPRDERSEGDRYLRAASTLEAWRASGVLRPDPAAAVYVYEQASAGHAQRGLLGALALSPPEDGIVLPHENTMSGTVSDRLALYTAVDADLEPIFLLYAGGGAASHTVASPPGAPLLDVTLADGLRHRLWAVTDPTTLAAIAADLWGRTAVIADGHHRYATYLQRQAAAWAAGRGAGPWDFGLTFLVDSTAFGPEVHPIHRVIPDVEAFELARRADGAVQQHDLDGDDLASALTALERAGKHSFLLVSGDGGTIRLLTSPDPDRLAAAMPAERSAAWRDLDVSVLHAFLVSDVWGLVDDVDTVRYEHDAESAVAAAAASGGTAVLLNPTPVDAVTSVAAGGERMPRKSTLFTPKPRTGLVIRDHRDG